MIKDYTLIKFLVLSLAVFISGMLLPGVDIANVWVAVALAAILSLLNRFVRPFLVLITLPVTVLTLGLFILIINGVIIYLADALVPDHYFNVSSFFMGIVFSLLVSFTSTVLEKLLGVKKKD